MSDFSDFAEREFHFLLDHGFRLSKSGEQQVEYKSDLYEISLFRDRDGVTLALNSIPSRKSGSVYFRTLLRKFNRVAADGFPAHDTVASDSAAKQRLKLIAKNFRLFVDFGAFESTLLFDELSASDAQDFATRYPTISVEQLRARFKAIWDRQEYAILWKQFEPLREHLTDEERQKLDIAKRVINEAGNA